MSYGNTWLSVLALAPDADRYNTDPATDVISMAKYRQCTFVIQEGAGGTGTATITVEECDDVTPTNSTAIAFKYRVAQTGDTFGALSDATASGVATVAGASKLVEVYVRAEDLTDGFPFVRLVLTEVVDSPVDAAVVAILEDPRYAGDNLPTALA